MISYVLIRLLAGRGEEIRVGTWVIAGLFALMFLATN